MARDYGDLLRWHSLRVGVSETSTDPVVEYLLYTQLSHARQLLPYQAWKRQQYIQWRCCSCTTEISIKLSKASRKSMYCSVCRGMYTDIGSSKALIEFKNHAIALLNNNIV